MGTVRRWRTMYSPELKPVVPGNDNGRNAPERVHSGRHDALRETSFPEAAIGAVLSRYLNSADQAISYL